MTVSTVDVSVVPNGVWVEVASSPSAPWYLKPNFTGGYRFAITASVAPTSATVGASYGANPYLPYEGIGPLPAFTGKAWVKVDSPRNEAQVTGNYPVIFTTIFTA
jgi:hypothetical protein